MGFENGLIIAHDLFLTTYSTQEAQAEALQTPGSFAVLTMAVQRSQPGRAGSVLVAGAPNGLAVLSTYSKQFTGVVPSSELIPAQ